MGYEESGQKFLSLPTRRRREEAEGRRGDPGDRQEARNLLDRHAASRLAMGTGSDALLGRFADARSHGAVMVFT